jgi:hypothetical protein
MKFKTLAIMAAAALFSAPLAYAAPTTLAADDMGGTNMSSGNGGDSMGNVANPNDMSATGPQANNDMMPGTSGGLGSSPAGQTPTDSSNSNDDMSADTATGDDDY